MLDDGDEDVPIRSLESGVWSLMLDDGDEDVPIRSLESCVWGLESVTGLPRLSRGRPITDNRPQ